jgi:signal transduction histidine kinase
MEPRRERAQIILIAAGLIGWALACAAGVLALREVGALDVPFLVAQLVFVVSFWINVQRPFVLPRRWVERAALGVQLIAALYIAGRVDARIAFAPFVILAGQAPFTLSPRPAIAFVVAQTAALFLLPVVIGGGLASWPDLITLGKFAGLESFALGAAMLAMREFKARQELFRLHAELLATQSLFAESLRNSERQRIARDLHDEMGHQLSALSLQLEVASHAPASQAAAAVAVARGISRDLMTSVRNVVGLLRLEEPLEMEPALRMLSAGIPHPQVHLDLPEGLTVEGPAQADALFHCVQEALTNAARHSGAANVWVRLQAHSGGIEVFVRDDGHGARTVSPGNGLLGMRERLEQIGGTLQLRHEVDHGFELRAWVPIAGRTP